MIEPPRPPRTPDLHRVLTLRDQLASAWLSELGGHLLAGDGWQRFLDRAAFALPAADPDALVESLRTQAGHRLSPDLARDTAHRLCGNLGRLKSGRPVPPWSVQSFPEWVPFQVVQVRPGPSAKGRPGAAFTLKAMAGTSCPRTARVWWSDGRCKLLARVLGFQRDWGPRCRRPPPRFSYREPVDFGALRLLGLVPTGQQGEPRPEEVRPAPALNAWNRSRLLARARDTPATACPRGHPDSLPCRLCWVGWVNCGAAVHRLDYNTRACSACGRPDALFDPEHPGDPCVDCRRREVHKRKRLL